MIMNVAIIFAGGSGKRMNTISRPKQFLELRGKTRLLFIPLNYLILILI